MTERFDLSQRSTKRSDSGGGRKKKTKPCQQLRPRGESKRAPLDPEHKAFEKGGGKSSDWGHEAFKSRSPWEEKNLPRGTSGNT